MRSLQDGSDIKTIVESDLIYSYAIALDLYYKKVYWIDLILDSLSSIDYNGNNRQLILKSYDLFSDSYSMDLFEDYIYWTNDRHKSVLKTNKFGLNKTSKIVVIQSDITIDALKIVHPLRQPNSVNRCLNSNCTQLCLPSGINSFRCLCPSFKYLKFNQSNYCFEKSEEMCEILKTSPLMTYLLIIGFVIELIVILYLIFKYKVVYFKRFSRRLPKENIINDNEFKTTNC